MNLKEPRVAVITLRAPQTQQRKKVVWTEDTVDNEHMNKKKSKCCCVYEKPHKFGESDSEDSDDECEHCAGHVERRKLKKSGTQQAAENSATATPTVQEETQPREPDTVITLQPVEPTPAPAPPDKDADNTA
ncbi:unnamed protein product [Arctia plantaginis]|uniref:E3 ubiquitin-protein ligase PPP1R11 n=1 Tax=Arctia plantaginis TaxID=874455 RepID=A0A8S0ZFB2_ARCPL|nr:unnamed protein product [Arctia plantaginis]